MPPPQNVTYRKIFDVLYESEDGKIFPSQKNYSSLVNSFLLDHFEIGNEAADDVFDVVWNRAIYVSGKLRSLWSRCGSGVQKLRNETQFLSRIIENPLCTEVDQCVSAAASGSAKRGRPKKRFSQKSRIGQHHDIVAIKAAGTTKAIITAASRNTRAEGHGDTSMILKELCQDPATKGSEIRAAMEFQRPKMLSVSEAAAHFLDMGFSVKQYNKMRMTSINQNACIYPSYKDIGAYLKQCQPDHIMSFATGVVAPMQSVLNHQVSRLLDLEWFERLKVIKERDPSTKFIFDVNYGADGSSGYSQFQHMNAPDQNSLFTSYLSMVQLTAKTSTSQDILYQNQFVRSPLGVVPLRFKYEVETKANSQRESKRLKDQCDNLVPYCDEETGIEIHFNPRPCILDGKTRDAWSEATGGCQSCPNCGAKPGEKSGQLGSRHGFVEKPERFKYGMSCLHSRINAFQWLCKAKIYSEVRKYAAVGPVNQASIKQQKKELIQGFKTELGLNVFKVNAAIGGSTNTGKVARKSFRNPQKFSQITGVPEPIISKLKTILDAVNCPFQVDPDVFQLLCDEWKDLFFSSDVAWNWLSPTVHNIIFHGASIIRFFAPTPPGLTSEEGPEHGNKFIRDDRDHHSRRTSVQQNLLDIFHRRSRMSDPVIVGHLSKTLLNERRKEKISPELAKLLVNPVPPSQIADDTSDQSDMELDDDDDNDVDMSNLDLSDN